jgi:uncharacterized protein (TIGR02246 family)
MGREAVNQDGFQSATTSEESWTMKATRTLLSVSLGLSIAAVAAPVFAQTLASPPRPFTKAQFVANAAVAEVLPVGTRVIQTPVVEADRAADARTLGDLVIAFERAFAAGDSRTLASMFTEDAQVADDSGATIGRPAIETRFQNYFAANPGIKIRLTVDSLRFLGPDVANEEGRAVVTPGTPGAASETTRYSVIYLRQGGRWLQSSVRDYAAETAVPDRLKELEWLVGDWVNESSESVVTTNCRWSDDRHYLLRDFAVTVQGKPVIKGSQRVGWDPAKKQIRSWVFDSDGGFSEGYWSRLGEQWMIKSHGVNHDGKDVSATFTITRLAPGRLHWRTTDRSRGGEAISGSDEYTMVRRPPQPGSVVTAPR